MAPTLLCSTPTPGHQLQGPQPHPSLWARGSLPSVTGLLSPLLAGDVHKSPRRHWGQWPGPSQTKDQLRCPPPLSLENTAELTPLRQTPLHPPGHAAILSRSGHPGCPRQGRAPPADPLARATPAPQEDQISGSPVGFPLWAHAYVLGQVSSWVQSSQVSLERNG